jgi:hypothetical protein
MTRSFRTIFAFIAVAAAILVQAVGCLADPVLEKGQTIFVPVYSHVLIGDRGTPFNIAATLSIMNTDLNYPITLLSADYYNAGGELVERMIPRPLVLKQLGSASFFIKERDTRGGFGAKFLVKWQSAKAVNAPIVQCIGIGSYSGQGISFITQGQEIR